MKSSKILEASGEIIEKKLVNTFEIGKTER